MDLVLDIGNTRLKAGAFEGNALVWQGWSVQDHRPFLEEILLRFDPLNVLISATGQVPDWLEAMLAMKSRLFWLDEHSPLPFTNAYGTPATLGKDRLAAMAGAIALGLNPPLLVIDAGTCVTCDLLEPGFVFRYGSISPGMAMRLHSMHRQTHRLPDIEPAADEVHLGGSDTASAMRAGAQMGLVCELEGRIDRLRAEFPALQVVITGGDQEFLVRNLKYVIFAHAELVLSGLNHILKDLSHAG